LDHGSKNGTIIRYNFNKYIKQYIYHIVFEDGAEGDVDFSQYVGKGPIFEPFKDVEFFRQAFIANGTISWSNGADIAPDTLYDKVVSRKRKKHEKGLV